jgi:gliding motility-associated-like protein
MKKTFPQIIFLLLLVSFNNLLAQAPVITYAGPQTYTVGTAIVPLAPVNTGGAVNGTGLVSTLAGNGSAGAVNGIGSAAEFNSPVGVAVDASNNVYVADAGNNLIRKITPAGMVTTFAGSGAAGSANGTGTAASFKGIFSITIDGAGYLYVSDANGIRKISPAGVVTTLAPSLAGLAIAADASGNLFAGAGRSLGLPAPIYKMTPSGVVTPYSSVPYSDNSDTLDITPGVGGMAVDVSGNVYAADSFNDAIFKITPGGAITTLAGYCDNGSSIFFCHGAIFNNPDGLAVDLLGNIYVADLGNNNIKVVDQAGNVSIFAGSVGGAPGFSNGSGGTFNSPIAVAVSPSNNLFVADMNNNAIRKIGIRGYTISPALPAGLVFDSATGTISGTATVPSPATNYTISGYNDAGTGATTLNITVNNILSVTSYPQAPIAVTTGIAFSISPIFTGGPPDSYTSSPALPAGISLNSATGVISGTPTAASSSANYNIIAHNAAGNDTLAVNITVNSPPPIPKISYAGPKTYAIGTAITPLSPSNAGAAVPPHTMVSTFAGNGSFGSVNGASLAASFANPVGVVINAVGNMFVLDNSSGLVRKISPTGVVSTFAGGFNGPLGIAVDAAGNLFVSDSGGDLIMEISPVGVITTFFTNNYLNPPCCGVGFVLPAGLAAPGGGFLLVANPGNQQIDDITPGGVSLPLNEGFPFSVLNNPWGITTDPFGNFYFSDQGTNNIYNSDFTPVAGSGTPGSTNGTGAAASFNTPSGVATDAEGNIYVADQGNNLIRKVTPAGVVTTFAGSGMQGSANGPDTLASFNRPAGITVDPYGNVYVTELGNNLIRKIVPGGYTISPALPAGLVFDGTTGTISGTPTALSPAVIYTITAYNTGGISTATVSIKVVSPSSNANLANLQLNTATLSPTFASATTTYTASVPNATSSITVTPTTSDSTATVMVNGNTTPSGSPSASIPLSVGSNTITVLVTAADGVTTKTYTITVTRLQGAGAVYAFLVNLQISSGTLSPAFASERSDYAAYETMTTSSITITPTTYDFATVKVNGMAVLSGTASPPISLSNGINYIPIVVTAQNGINTKTYYVAAVRGAIATRNIDLPLAANDGQLADDGIKVHSGVSPNGDGINDVLVIDGITAYPENKLSIINRDGTLVFEGQGYDNSTKVFDGHSSQNGSMQLPGTYFYSLEYKVGNVTKHATGFIILKY